VSIPSDSFLPEDEQNIQPDSNQVPITNVEETPLLPETEPEVTGPEVASAASETSAATSSEFTLPPEAQGEANGGPLGCCLGIVVGLLLTFFVITIISVSIHNGGYLGAATAPIGILGGIIGGFSGWRIGKAIYHEYELSPERRERLERLEHQWRTRRKRT
jgi:hypothetical protein